METRMLLNARVTPLKLGKQLKVCNHRYDRSIKINDKRNNVFKTLDHLTNDFLRSTILFGKTLYIFHIQGVVAALESCENEIPAKCKNAPDDTSSTIEKCMKSAEDFRQCCQRGRIPKNKQIWLRGFPRQSI